MKRKFTGPGKSVSLIRGPSCRGYTVGIYYVFEAIDENCKLINEFNIIKIVRICFHDAVGKIVEWG